MPNEIEVEYNLSLQPLEDLLSKVSRPGEFFINGERISSESTHELGSGGENLLLMR